MPKNTFVDFKAVKAAIAMEQVLEHYGLSDRFKKSGDSLSGPCPIHKGSNPTQFRVSISKNIWNCFSECKHGGNTLDFIAIMDKVSIHAAAQRAIKWFNLDTNAMSAKSTEHEGEPDDSPRDDAAAVPKSAPRKPSSAPEKSAPNPILKFRLDKLDRDHPYLSERGLTPETIEHFEVGFCSKGMMAGRIAIPIHTVDGGIVGYAGRFPGEPPGDTPKYKLPPGFRKSLELFNIDRAIQELSDTPLVIVEGFFGCMRVWQQGVKRVVALMGSTLSPEQEELICKRIDRVVLMLDEDDVGRAGREDMAIRLSKFIWVKVHTFDKEDQQPEDLSVEKLTAAML